MEESILKLQLLEKKDLAEPEIDIRYSSMTQPLIRSNVVRISKTVLLNISCLVCVKPYPNHRLLAELNNEENLIVSRKYIPILRDKIRSGYYE